VRATQQLLRFNWEVLDHQVYKPDLLPSNFHLLLHLKKRLSGQKFQEDETVKNVTTAWLHSQEFFEFRIRELILRLNKCLDKDGE